MRSNVLYHGAPLIGTSRQEVMKAGIETIPRVTGTLSGRPQVEGGRSLPADAVVWATGFRPDFNWINPPVFDKLGYPRHQRGIVPEAPGLYFVGLPFQTALSSALLGGVGADADYIAGQITKS
jgi:putative flavoprotein involved in K+ transport